jgi:death-on-curing protein
MKRWRWVKRNVVYAIHDRQLAEHGGLDGIRDENAVEAALSRPKNLAQYENPDIASLAASYAYNLARGHWFSDGNKRTAWVVARLFLLDNRHTIEFESPEAVKLMEGVAAGTISENDLGQWFRKRLHPLRRRSQ